MDLISCVACKDDVVPDFTYQSREYNDISGASWPSKIALLTVTYKSTTAPCCSLHWTGITQQYNSEKKTLYLTHYCDVTVYLIWYTCSIEESLFARRHRWLCLVAPASRLGADINGSLLLHYLATLPASRRRTMDHCRLI